MKRHPITKFLVVFMSLLLICTSVLSVPSSVEAAANPKKITLATKKQTLYVGQKYKLTVKSVTPANASKAVKFATSNKKIATVNASGQITAKKVGTATITVTSKGNSKAKATCKITVKPAVKSITVKNSVSNTVAVRLKKTLKLQTSVAPTNAANKKLTFKTSNKKVVTVDKKGKLKAKKVGKAKITITALGGKAKKVIKVIVPDKKKEVKSVKLSTTAQTLTVGGKFKLNTTFTPAKVATKLVSYKSSNAKVATVDGKGNVTAVAPGTAKITVTSLDGAKKATCTVTVKPVYVSAITLSAATATLEAGKTLTLTATVAPANAANKNVTWTSSNPAVATVANGVVTAVAAGTTTITVTAADGSGVKATCVITVTKKEDPKPVDPKPEDPKPEDPKPEDPVEVKVTGITLNATSAEVEVGKTVTVTATVAPENATNKNINWTSSNASVATVENGVVTAVAAGEAVITATAADGSGVTATCTITVKAAGGTEEPDTPGTTVAVTEVTLNKTTLSLVAGAEETLTATVAPENASNKNVTWTSSNTAVATVVDGKVVAVAAGTATITVTTADGGKTATCTVTVTAAGGEEPDTPVAVTGVTLNKETTSLVVGAEETLTATVAPANATNKDVTWTSDNTEVATVDNTGKVTAVAAGTATITVTTADGGKTATCTVTVTAAGGEEPDTPDTPVAVTGVTLNPTTQNLVVGGTATLTATVAPANATNQNVTWTSSDETVATVENGVVTAVAVGTATITVTTEDGEKTATCEITVVEEEVAIESVTLPATMTIYANTTDAKLEAVVNPENTTMDKKVTYTSSNGYVLAVGENGELTPMITYYTGNDREVVTVTATTSNGKTATCEVTIILREDAKGEDENNYLINLNKNAESYYVAKGSKNVTVSANSVKTDIATLAGMEWDNNSLKKYWNTDELNTFIAKFVLAEEFGVDDYMDSIKVNGLVMTVTAKGRTITVTRIDNVDGTSSLKVVAAGKTVNILNVNVASTETSYVISSTIDGMGQVRKLEITIAKDASALTAKISANNATNLNTALSVTEEENEYKVKINKIYYDELLGIAGIADPLPTITVVNNYIPVQ